MSGAAATNDANAKGRAGREMVPPTRILDGFGAFGPPTATTRPVPVGYVARASADHPPGFYGPPEGLLAVNTLAPADRLTTIDFAPLNARLEAYQVGEPQDLRGPVLIAALALLALDALVVFFLAGGHAQICADARNARPRHSSRRIDRDADVGMQALAQEQPQRGPPARMPAADAPPAASSVRPSTCRRTSISRCGPRSRRGSPM